MTWRWVTTVAATVALATVAGAGLVATAPSRPAGGAGNDARDDWRSVLERAAQASRSVAFEGRMVVVTFGPSGPDVAEVELAQDASGALRVVQAETWMVGRAAGQAFYRDLGDSRGAATLLRLGGVDRSWLSLDAIAAKYHVVVAGSHLLDIGPATVVELTARRDGALRERLYVHADTGLVVRRDTFDTDGAAARVVAVTRLDVTDQLIAPPTVAEATLTGTSSAVDAAALARLERGRWVVPDTLPGRYRLASAYLLPDADGRLLHLVYSDGLYTVSLYQQHGRMDGAAVAGAVAVGNDDVHVLGWPGSEPERMVWTGAGLTFTVVSDAPDAELMEMVAALPNDPPPSFAERVGRGLVRLAAYLWPFG